MLPACGRVLRCARKVAALCRYSYIPHLVHSFKGAINLKMVPNYALSSALAAYYESKSSATATPDTATGVHEPGSQPELDAKLITAICSFPTALSELVKALQEKVGCRVCVVYRMPSRSCVTVSVCACNHRKKSCA